MSSNIYRPVSWVPMRYEADCWVAACAMAAGITYEEAEKHFGSSAEYSAKVLCSEEHERIALNNRNIRLLSELLSERGYRISLLVFGPDFKPELGKRYFLGCESPDPQRAYMAHAFVVDEAGQLFDPDPGYSPGDPRYRFENYREIIGFEISRAQQTKKDSNAKFKRKRY
jgi:hypothetical protein